LSSHRQAAIIPWLVRLQLTRNDRSNDAGQREGRAAAPAQTTAQRDEALVVAGSAAWQRGNERAGLAFFRAACRARPEWRPAWVRLAAAAAELLGRRAQAEDKLEELATTDALTGLENRRKFDIEIDTEWRRGARAKVPLALLMIDADHFKSYNDTFGHQAGDQMLVGIAICISDSVRRAGDCTARYGGEEFAVLLTETDKDAAVPIAESLRGIIERTRFFSDDSRLTISVGVSSFPTDGADPAALVQAADRALYQAKAAGRNRVQAA